MQERKLDTIELAPMPDKSLAFRVSRANGHIFCIIPDFDILKMPDYREKYHQLAEWATLTAKGLGLPIRFRVGLDSHSLDWETEKEGQYIPLFRTGLN